MLKKDLAEGLGVSAAMVSKLAARGMPTDSLGAARAWRDRNLEQARRKEFRAKLPQRKPAAAGGMDPGEAALQHAEAIGRVAARMLAAGSFGEIRVELQAAMAAVPQPIRHRLQLDEPLWSELVREVHDELEAEKPAGGASVSLSDSDVVFMGDFWYSVAIGEVRVTRQGDGL